MTIKQGQAVEVYVTVLGGSPDSGMHWIKGYTFVRQENEHDGLVRHESGVFEGSVSRHPMARIRSTETI